MTESQRDITNDPAGFETLESISKASKFNFWMFNTIKPHIKAGSILELGSGIGNITDFLINSYSDVTISDFNIDYCSYLKTKYKDCPSIKNIIKIDLQDEMFEQHYEKLKDNFDSIILINVIEHLADDTTAIRNCKYLLKKSGNLIVLAPAYSKLYSNFDAEIGHFRRYTGNDLTDLFRLNKMKIIKKFYFNFLGIPGWFVFNKLLKRKRISSSNMKVYDKLVPIAKVLDKLSLNRIGLSEIIVGEKER